MLNGQKLVVPGIAVLLVAGALASSPRWTLLYKRSGHEVRFSRDIRPIFNQNCVACHGGVRQKNGVSFIFRGDALGVGKSGRRTIVPGKPEESELIARVTSKDPQVRMPYHAAALPPQQIALLRQWIKEGANWEDHWAFVPPKPQPRPAIKRANWARQPLDQFILARLERESLEPSLEADKAFRWKTVVERDHGVVTIEHFRRAHAARIGHEFIFDAGNRVEHGGKRRTTHHGRQDRRPEPALAARTAQPPEERDASLLDAVSSRRKSTYPAAA